MTITHIFFDLHGTLIDGPALHPCYSAQLGRFMSQRFGRSPADWIEANQRILADWDSYYADLDLTGERGIEDMWEGMYRTTRGMFRIVGVSEPDRKTIRDLSRELPGLVTRYCNALFKDSRPVIERLCAVGFVLGVTSHAISGQARGVLRGGEVLRYFSGPILGPDVVGRFQKAAYFYDCAARMAEVAPQNCVAVDDTADCIAGAKSAGMRTVHIARMGSLVQSPAHHILKGDLYGLLDYLGVPGNGTGD
jgi:FMN phosphatase YigB (HAD superfamily)